MVDAPATPTTEEVDPFAAAFADIVKGDTPAETAPAAKTPEQQAAELEGASAGVTEQPATGDLDTSDAEERQLAPTHKEDGTAFTAEEVATEQARLDAEAAAAKAAKETSQTPTPAPTPEDAMSRLADLLAARQPAQQQPAQQQPQQRQPVQQQPILSAQEQQFVAEYEREFPDVARAEALKRRQEYNFLVAHIFNQITSRYDPLIGSLHDLSTRQAQDDLHVEIADYDDVRDKVISWVDAQPDGIMKRTYEQIVNEGTVGEIKELVGVWRQATGAAPAAAAAAPAPVAQKGPSEAARRAAAAMAPVRTARSTPVATPDKNDFEGAFAEAAKAVA